MTNRPIKRFGRTVQLVTDLPDGSDPPIGEAPRVQTETDVIATVQPVPSDMMSVEEYGDVWDRYRLFYVDSATIPNGLKFIKDGGKSYRLSRMEQWPTYFTAIGVDTSLDDS